VKVALIHPPTCDPTAPYLAIPTLAAFLRARGVEVLPVDANLEAWELALDPENLARLLPHGRCAFCHYGLAEKGTAPYRERPSERVAEHLALLSSTYGARLFYLSEGTITPEISPFGRIDRYRSDVISTEGRDIKRPPLTY
jgi:hypothetical protein